MAGIVPTSDLVIGDGGAALPPGGYISTGDARAFWFVTISDTQDCWADPAKAALLHSFLAGTLGTIQPVFTINTGDLVESDITLFTRSAGQLANEWQAYNTTITSAGLNASTYFDVLGNHDAYGDPARTSYLVSSMSGSSFGTPQFAVDLRLPWGGQYAFAFLATPEPRGLEFPFSWNGYLPAAQLDWLDGALAARAGANLTFTFGHHPLLDIVSERAASGETLLGILRARGVAYYGCGHGDINANEAVGTTAAVETARFSLAGGTYRITAVDNDHVSSVAAQVGAWPAGLITAPTAPEFTLGAFNFTAHAAADTIRCLAWDPAGVASVAWRAIYPNKTATAWATMSHASGPLWSAPLAGALASGVSVTLEANITNTAGTSVITRLTYSPGPAWHFGRVEATYLLAITIAALAVAVPVARRWGTQARTGGKSAPAAAPMPRPDPVARNVLVVKLLAFLALPLVDGLMWGGAVTWAFWWGLVGSSGVAWSDWALLAGGIAVIPLIAQALALRPDRARRLRSASIASLVIVGSLVAFYLTRYPAVAWVAPGYYILILADVVMARRAGALLHGSPCVRMPAAARHVVTYEI